MRPTNYLKAANHTGRELKLMLSGCKPLAMFYAMAEELPDERLIPEKKFGRYVAQGLFVRADASFETEHPKTHRLCEVKYVFFARKEEKWRIPALALVVRTYQRMRKTDEGIERIESALLGYTDEEIDAWCKHQLN